MKAIHMEFLLNTLSAMRMIKYIGVYNHVDVNGHFEMKLIFIYLHLIDLVQLIFHHITAHGMSKFQCVVVVGHLPHHIHRFRCGMASNYHHQHHTMNAIKFIVYLYRRLRKCSSV